MWFRLNLILFFVVLLIEINAKPFFKNTVQTISSSISSAASSDSANISDLRRRRFDKIRQLSKYNEEFADDNGNEDQAIDDQEKNEALPNLLQKKMAKIMRKLQFIAQLISRFTPLGGRDEDRNKNDDKDFDFDFDSEEMGAESNSTASGIIDERKEDEAFDLNAENRDKEEFIEDLSPKNGADKNPAGLGVHFLEVLGSLFGIIYGAAIQLTNGGNAKPSL